MPTIPSNQTSENDEREYMDSQKSVGRFATISDEKHLVSEILVHENEYVNSQMSVNRFDVHPVENHQDCQVSVDAFISKDDVVQKLVRKNDISKVCGSVCNPKQQLPSHHLKGYVNTKKLVGRFDSYPVENSQDCEVSVDASKEVVVQTPMVESDISIVCSPVSNLKQQLPRHHVTEYVNSKKLVGRFYSQPVENSQDCEVSVDESKEVVVQKPMKETDISNMWDSVCNLKQQLLSNHQKEYVNSQKLVGWFDSHPVENSLDFEPIVETDIANVWDSVCSLKQQLPSNHQKEYVNFQKLVGRFDSHPVENFRDFEPMVETDISNVWDSVCNIIQQLPSNHQKEFANSQKLVGWFDSHPVENSQDCEASVGASKEVVVQTPMVESDISDVCGSVCNLKQQSSNYLQVYSNEKDCIGEQYGVEFNNESGLQWHFFNDTEEKPLICNVCGKAYTQSSSLKTHLCLHASKNSFVCEVCGKTLAKKSRIRHLRIHTQEKPYACEVCGRAFADSKTLKEHLRTHTKEKPYVCGVCGKGFIQLSNLKRHLKSQAHTEEKPL